jgi:SAM-dependent methyltransferase
VLGLSWVYDWFQTVVGLKRSYDIIVSDYLGDVSGARVLDIGCGTATIANWLEGASYSGFDPNPSYVAKAQVEADATRRVWEGSIEQPRLDNDQYDLILGLGVLHHVDDMSGREFFELAERHLAPGGKVVTVDPCVHTGQSRLARALVKRDRGRWVRRPEEYRRLVGQKLGGVRATVRDDLLRIPYSHVILELSRDDGKAPGSAES